MILSQVDLKSLRIYVKIAERQGFAAAQEELNMSQSALSTYMTNLETRLGLHLCERGRGGFRLTDEGQAVYDAAVRLFESIDEFSLEIYGRGGRLSGELRVATIDAVATNPSYRLQEAIQRFTERDADAKLSLNVGSPSDVERGVAENRFDIGIGFNLKNFRITKYRSLFVERQLLYCGQGHPLFDAGCAALTAEDVARYGVVAQPYGPQPPQGSTATPSIEAVTNNIEAAALLVLSGCFLGYLPEHFATQWVRQDRLRPVGEKAFQHELEGGVIVRKKGPHAAILRAFVADLLSVHGNDAAGSAREFLD